MSTTNNSIEKKCYFDYLVNKYTSSVRSQKEQEQKVQYNTTMKLANVQTVALKTTD